MPIVHAFAREHHSLQHKGKRPLVSYSIYAPMQSVRDHAYVYILANGKQSGNVWLRRHSFLCPLKLVVSRTKIIMRYHVRDQPHRRKAILLAETLFRLIPSLSLQANSKFYQLRFASLLPASCREPYHQKSLPVFGRL